MATKHRRRSTPVEPEESSDEDSNLADPAVHRRFGEYQTSSTSNPKAHISDQFKMNFLPKLSVSPIEASHEKRTNTPSTPLSNETERIQSGNIDPKDQVKQLLIEKAELIRQTDALRSQFERHSQMIKRRLEETESDNERLLTQYRTAAKELVLYKSLAEAPDNPDPASKSKDYQQVKASITEVMKENERLQNELQNFKTTDPVYEQVQLLESANQQLKQDIKHLTMEIDRLRVNADPEETKQLKLQLAQSLNEYERIKLINEKLVHQLSTSPKQTRVFQSSPLTTSQGLYQFPSPASQRSSRSSPGALSTPQHFSTEIVQLRQHVQHLEETLHKRDNELQKLQNEIEKGTNSIMSSLDDLYLVSTNGTPTNRMMNRQVTVDDLQNELDQLHDKLDELTRENQVLKTRTQEFDTIYEENEFLYAEKARWNEEIEQTRVRQLVLEQELQTLKGREKEFLNANETSLSNPNNNNHITNNNSAPATAVKLKIDILNQRNHQLELEVVQLREQIETIVEKYELLKEEYHKKTEHFRRVFEAAEKQNKIPEELIRIEKLNIEMEQQFESDRDEYEKIIAAMEETVQQREQKYSSLYETVSKLQNDLRQREMEFMHQMDEVVKQRDQFRNELQSLKETHKQLKDENQALIDEIKSNSNINRDLKSALNSSNIDTQSVQSQLKQLKSALSQQQERFNQELAEKTALLEKFKSENKKIIANCDEELLKNRQIIIQLQHDKNQYANQLDKYRSNVGKLNVEIGEKRNFIEQVQNDITERSSIQFSINNQLSQEVKIKTTKIMELEQSLAQEQQRKTELQRTIQELQMELIKARSLVKESTEKSEEIQRRCQETDKHFLHLNELSEPVRRELHSLRNEVVSKSDQITLLQHAIEDEKLKKQRLEMKLKRLKEEYINVRKDLYVRVEENNKLQHDLVASRMKNDYYAQLNNQTLESIRSSTESEQTTAIQLYLKEKAENQHCQLKCRAYQQKLEQLQKSYEVLKDKYKERVQEEREVFERAKRKYLDHIKNVQHDLHETRKLLEKDAELKMNQETAYQQLIDERRQLLTSIVEKDAKIRETRRENILLLSKIQLLENQMEGLNERVDRTLRERNHPRREVNAVRLDTNLSIATSARTSPNSLMSKNTSAIDQNPWQSPVYHTSSFGFSDAHHQADSKTNN